MEEPYDRSDFARPLGWPVAYGILKTQLLEENKQLILQYYLYVPDEPSDAE